MDSPSPAPPLAAGRHPDSIDEGGAGAVSGDPFPLPGGAAKLRLMCSYGGHITPRPHDNSLCYVGGDTRIVVVDRNSPLSELLQRLSRILLGGRSFTLKYQLPSEDLDSLITVSSEEDLDNMIDEYDRLNSASNAAKPSRLRLFLFPAKLEVAASMGPILDGSNKSDEWFLNALNGATILQRGFSDPASAYSLLELNNSGNLEPNSKGSEAVAETGLGLGAGKGKIGNLSNQDVHSIPDSPVVETSSSFGSTSSSPSLTNLPPIRVQVDGTRVFDQRTGIEEHFANMGIGVHKQEDSFPIMSSHPNLPSTAPAGDYTDRIVSDDERSDHGVPVGYRKPPQPQTMMLPAYQPQPKQMSGDLLSPDSIASDNSLTNASSRKMPAIYQESFGSNLMPPNFIDPNSGSHIQIQPVSNSGYMMQQQPQYELHPQQQQPQQYIQVQTNNQYGHHLPGGVPVYYVPAGQQPPNQHPVYYVPAGQNHPAYNFPVQQPNCTEVTGQPQNLKQPNPTLIPPNSAYNVASNLPSSKAEITQAGVYSTTTNIPPQLVQVPSHHQQQQQPQFVGYSQVQHPTAPPPSSVSPPPSYAYELAEPVQNQLYFTQPLAPQTAAQYQTMTSSSAMVMSDVSSTEHVNPQ